MNKKVIYLDNNATTQIDDRVLHTMMPFFTTNYANANSTHRFGETAYEAVRKARMQVADLISAQTNEIIFTSGATEAINLAIKGVAENYGYKGKHIITVATEHSAVLDTCENLESKGFEVTYLSVKPDGLIDLDELKSSLKSDTILVSVMYVNNETGVIQPIKEIAALSQTAGAFFMTDATQAIGKIAVNVDELNIDMLCFSGHKIYAPKGVGVLYIRQKNPNRVKLIPMQHGGGQEGGLRSGTLNVPGIAALGAACELAQKEMINNQESIAALRDYLESGLLEIEDTSVNGNRNCRLYNTSNILFIGVDSNALIAGLSHPAEDFPLIAISNGSACNSASIEPSHVLTAMGLNEEAAFSSIRFSFGKYNTLEEINVVIDTIKNVAKKLRQMID